MSDLKGLLCGLKLLHTHQRSGPFLYCSHPPVTLHLGPHPVQHLHQTETQCCYHSLLKYHYTFISLFALTNKYTTLPMLRFSRFQHLHYRASLHDNSLHYKFLLSLSTVLHVRLGYQLLLGSKSTRPIEQILGAASLFLLLALKG